MQCTEVTNTLVLHFRRCTEGSRNLIEKLENGKVNPTLYTLLELASALGISLGGVGGCEVISISVIWELFGSIPIQIIKNSSTNFSE
ncbi:helix-turn-helix transcriptional regulator [Chryseobacterium sp.]|uniref:helix-turn-helix domain-containing protein n=1 Tax=Chryseobacterium sp. TaxID=1871047 RepID=UPI0028991883|nr:helix-turn-helix transcriptional regulator [Chryseobacterium sp.]